MHIVKITVCSAEYVGIEAVLGVGCWMPSLTHIKSLEIPNGNFYNISNHSCKKKLLFNSTISKNTLYFTLVRPC